MSFEKKEKKKTLKTPVIGGITGPPSFWRIYV
jgi:hypothetical protein